MPRPLTLTSPWGALIAWAAVVTTPLSAAPPRRAAPSPASNPSPATASDPAEEEPTFVGPSAAGTKVLEWILETRDNGDRPFILIDKLSAQIFVFDSSGVQLAREPVLLGTARGDESAPGVGNRELSHIPVSERTTPAGRFSASFGAAVGYSEPVLWVDYADAIALHPILNPKPAEHRPERLQSLDPGDNRITFGCINVGRSLFDEIIKPLFGTDGGMVYILPETRVLDDVFPSIAPDAFPPPSPFIEAFASYRLPALPRDEPEAPTRLGYK